MKYLFLLSALLLIKLTFSQNHIEPNTTMKQILKEISMKAIELGDYNSDLTDEQLDMHWIGYDPALKSEIENIEKRLGVSFPVDFVEFLNCLFKFLPLW